MDLKDIKLSIFKDLQSYESKAVGLDTVLWWIKSDLSVQQKTELYRNLAKTITREEANKKVKDSIMPAFSVAVVFNGLGKQTTHATRVTGLSICDIDHVEPSKMEEESLRPSERHVGIIPYPPCRLSERLIETIRIAHSDYLFVQPLLNFFNFLTSLTSNKYESKIY